MSDQPHPLLQETWTWIEYKIYPPAIDTLETGMTGAAGPDAIVLEMHYASEKEVNVPNFPQLFGALQNLTVTSAGE